MASLTLFVRWAVFAALLALTAAQTCPQHAAQVSPGKCQCQRGFSGTITCSGLSCTGTCTLAPCPLNAQAVVLPSGVRSCSCNAHFQTSGVIQWDVVRQQWTGGCTGVACPPSAVATAAGSCACRPGFVSNGLLYNSNTRTWTGSCVASSAGAGSGFGGGFGGGAGGSGASVCPPNASGSPCRCNSGYGGNLFWIGTRWAGTCSGSGIPGAAFGGGGAGAGAGAGACSNIRREWNSLSQPEKDLYLEAVATLSRMDYARVISQHTRPIMDDYAHRSDGFYPWHRLVVFQFEEQLRGLGGKFSCISIPYWDWTRTGTNMQMMQTFGGAFPGCMQTLGGRPFGYQCVRRNSAQVNAPGINFLSAVVSAPTFTRLTQTTLLPHNSIHNGIGGNMGTIQSIYDPIFMPHHAFIDYLWHLWAKCHNSLDTGAAGPGIMPGFDSGLAPQSVANTMKLGRGYTFAPSAFELSSAFTTVCPGAGNADIASRIVGGSGATQRPFPVELLTPSMYPTDSITSMSADGYQPNLDSLKFTPREVEEVDMFANEINKLAPNDLAPNSTVLFQASRTTCEAQGTMRDYSECTGWSLRMCSCEMELDSALLDPCTKLAANVDEAQLRVAGKSRDTECLATKAAAKAGGATR